MYTLTELLLGAHGSMVAKAKMRYILYNNIAPRSCDNQRRMFSYFIYTLFSLCSKSSNWCGVLLTIVLVTLLSAIRTKYLYTTSNNIPVSHNYYCFQMCKQLKLS